MIVLTWQARSNKNITLVKLAELTGIENEKVSPTLDELEAIAKALDVRITDLFDSEYK